MADITFKYIIEYIMEKEGFYIPPAQHNPDGITHIVYGYAEDNIEEFLDSLADELMKSNYLSLNSIKLSYSGISYISLPTISYKITDDTADSKWYTVRIQSDIEIQFEINFEKKKHWYISGANLI